ncbi:MAG TPA: tRNA (adenosine(37)-N6)-threonylcarbamoyltransferase complex ATPase subunit type 1 TsaE [Pirellulales bacterium]|nr:tRNA (adenosine(37)-N6)-threonylcarbamoyltransferase complex ATPase subunit type 1 TsaE [Pirellulales bacterium]
MMPDPLVIEVADELGTERFAASLAAVLPERVVISLSGTLGAGKTRFVKALAAAAGVDPLAVTSPTFVLIQEYAGDRPIFHFDVYRLRDEDEFLALAPEEYFDRPGWTILEWGERFARCLPPDRLDISIDVTGPTSRQFKVQGHGSDNATCVGRLRNAIAP